MRISDTIDKTKSAVHLRIVAGGRLKVAGEQADFGEHTPVSIYACLSTRCLSRRARFTSRDKITIFL